MQIVQIGTADKAGGAESVAWQLFQAYRSGGHDCTLLVGCKRSQDADVIELTHDHLRSPWTQRCMAAADRLGALLGPLRGVRRLQAAIKLVAGQPRRWWERQQGREDFDFPGTWRIPGILKTRPDVLHCHKDRKSVV